MCLVFALLYLVSQCYISLPRRFLFLLSVLPYGKHAFVEKPCLCFSVDMLQKQGIKKADVIWILTNTLIDTGCSKQWLVTMYFHIVHVLRSLF